MKNKLQFMFSFMFLAAIGLFAVSVQAQGIGDRNTASSGGSHNITGKVLLPDGTPAVRVKVSANTSDFTNTSSTTDANGAFLFGGLPGGNYEISVAEKGYEKATERLTIERFATSGQNYQVTIHLRTAGQPRAETGSGSNPLLKNIPKDAIAKFDLGVEKMAKNDAGGALSLFNEAIALYPNFAAAHYERGAALLKMNDLDKAMEAFVKAVTIKPDYLEAKYGYGMALFQKKNYEVAEAVFRDVLKQKPDMAEAHLNLGISLFYLKNGNAAESELKAAVNSKGGEKLALGHLYLGQIYIMKKQNTDAASELQKYVDLAPKAPNAEKIKATIADLKKQS